MDHADVEVLHEEIITHPTAERGARNWKGEARIMGEVEINGEVYVFEHVVNITFTKASHAQRR